MTNYLPTTHELLPRVAIDRLQQVLLVEDNAGDADLASEHLTGPPAPFHVHYAKSVAQAEKLLAALQLDAIVLDLNVEDSRGLDTLTRVKAAARGTPIIVLSGIADEQLRKAALAGGAVDFLSKDDARTTLLSRSVLYIVERNRALEQHRRLESLLATTPDAILVVGETGVVRYVNEASLRLFGRAREEFLGELLGFSVKDGEPIKITVPRTA